MFLSARRQPVRFARSRSQPTTIHGHGYFGGIPVSHAFCPCLTMFAHLLLFLLPFQLGRGVRETKKHCSAAGCSAGKRSKPERSGEATTGAPCGLQALLTASDGIGGLTIHCTQPGTDTQQESQQAYMAAIHSNSMTMREPAITGYPRETSPRTNMNPCAHLQASSMVRRKSVAPNLVSCSKSNIEIGN